MALKGKLGSIAISDIAQLLHLNKKTGMLKVNNKGFSGMLFFNEGKVVNAESTDNKAEIAAYEVFQQFEGDFEFISTPPHKQEVINQSLHDIVLESARQKDTIKRLRTAIPKNYLIFRATIDVRMDSFQGSLPKDAVRVLGALDGTKDVDDVIESMHFSEFKVLSIIVDLIDRKFVEKVDIVKNLSVGLLKGIFKSEDTAFVDNSVYDDWEQELITENKMKNLQIRTKHNRILTLKLSKKKGLKNTVLMAQSQIDALKIREGETVIVKPVSKSAENGNDDTLLEDFFE